jgi:hypothetical protein
VQGVLSRYAAALGLPRFERGSRAYYSTQQVEQRCIQNCMFVVSLGSLTVCLSACLACCCACCLQGMDGRVMHPSTRKELAYVVALGGEHSSRSCTHQTLSHALVRVPSAAVHLVPHSAVAHVS